MNLVYYLRPTWKILFNHRFVCKICPIFSKKKNSYHVDSQETTGLKITTCPRCYRWVWISPKNRKSVSVFISYTFLLFLHWRRTIIGGRNVVRLDISLRRFGNCRRISCNNVVVNKSISRIGDSRLRWLLRNDLGRFYKCQIFFLLYLRKRYKIDRSTSY